MVIGKKVKYEVIDPESGNFTEGFSDVYGVHPVPFPGKHPISNETTINVVTFLLLIIDSKFVYLPSDMCTVCQFE